jgi:hypothetical protein
LGRVRSYDASCHTLATAHTLADAWWPWRTPAPRVPSWAALWCVRGDGIKRGGYLITLRISMEGGILAGFAPDPGASIAREVDLLDINRPADASARPQPAGRSASSGAPRASSSSASRRAPSVIGMSVPYVCARGLEEVRHARPGRCLPRLVLVRRSRTGLPRVASFLPSRISDTLTFRAFRTLSCINVEVASALCEAHLAANPTPPSTP